MGRAILMSIHPEWVEKIASGEKTVEVRKTAPLEKCPFRVYIYQTKPKSGDWNDMDGMVIGEFMCKCIMEYNTRTSIMYSLSEHSCVPIIDLKEYVGARDWIFGWKISDVRMFKEPVPLPMFSRPCTRSGPCNWCKHAEPDPQDGHLHCENRVQRPPQSWMYVEEVNIE